MPVERCVDNRAEPAPGVTVLMSVYNDLRFLAESVGSIRAQTFGDFEFLIIDDGSTDGSAVFLAGVRDARVRVVRNDANIGLTPSLNRGLDLARGAYVARMDADDVAAPERLARQVEFLDRHPDVGIVGSSRVLIDEVGAVVSEARAVPDDLGIRWKCLLGNPFAHPTVMIRRDVLERHALRYDESFVTAQDYELWTRLLPHTRGANLEEALLCYRLRAGLSRTHKAEQLANHDRIAHAAVRGIVPRFQVSLDEVRELRGRYGGYSVREARMDPADQPWVGRYVEMLEAFVEAHAGEPGISEFARRQRDAISAYGNAVAA